MAINKSLFATTISLVYCLAGCVSNAPPSTNGSVSTHFPEQSISTNIEIVGTNFYQNLDLQTGEQVAIFDLLGSQVIFSIYKDYTTNDPEYREVGYSSYSTRTAVYDLEAEAILYDIPLAADALCVDAAFSGEKMVIVSVGISSEETSYYDVQLFDHQTMISLERRDCSPFPDNIPGVSSLGDGAFAYSFYHTQEGIFGVNIITDSAEVTPQIALTESIDTHNITTDLHGNGTNYLYYAETNGQPTFFVGTDKGVENQFVLPKNERYYSYCLLPDCIVFSSAILENGEDDRGTKYLVVRNLSGKILEQISSPVFYRLASDGSDKLLGIDSDYAPQLISLDGGIKYQRIEDIEASPVLFYGLHVNCFLLHYNGFTEEGAPKVEILTIRH